MSYGFTILWINCSMPNLFASGVRFISDAYGCNTKYCFVLEGRAFTNAVLRTVTISLSKISLHQNWECGNELLSLICVISISGASNLLIYSLWKILVIEVEVISPISTAVIHDVWRSITSPASDFWVLHQCCSVLDGIQFIFDFYSGFDGPMATKLRGLMFGAQICQFIW